MRTLLIGTLEATSASQAAPEIVPETVAPARGALKETLGAALAASGVRPHTATAAATASWDFANDIDMLPSPAVVVGAGTRARPVPGDGSFSRSVAYYSRVAFRTTILW